MPSVVTSSFHSQQPQENNQHQQQQQVVTALNGNSTFNGTHLHALASSMRQEPTNPVNGITLQRPLINITGQHEQNHTDAAAALQSMSSTAFPHYSGLTIPNQSKENFAF